MTLPRSVPHITNLDPRRTAGLMPIRLAAASLLAACLAFGTVAGHAQLTSSAAAIAGHSIVSPNDGPCWGCGG